ncbi:MAG: sulfotransferase [Sulfurimonas sp.]|nr:sulfotransferase [Sulfurimonas sp.]
MPYNIMKMLWLQDRHVLFDEDKIFDEDYCKYYYLQHIKEVKEYFQGSANLLILNVEEKGSYKKLCEFLGKETKYDEFPHLNQTKEQ